MFTVIFDQNVSLGNKIQTLLVFFLLSWGSASSRYRKFVIPSPGGTSHQSRLFGCGRISADRRMSACFRRRSSGRWSASGSATAARWCGPAAPTRRTPPLPSPCARPPAVCARPRSSKLGRPTTPRRRHRFRPHTRPGRANTQRPW